MPSSQQQQQQQQQQHQKRQPRPQPQCQQYQQPQHQHQQHQQQHPQHRQHQQRHSQQQRVQKQLVGYSKLWKHRHDRSILKPNLLRLESLNVSLESLFFDQAGLDSKFNNSSTATGTMQSTSSTMSTTSGATDAGPEKQQARQLVDCLKSIDHTLMGEKKLRYRISCSFRTFDSNCKSLFNFLRGKGTANGVAPTKMASAVPGDANEAPPSSTAMVAHRKPPQHGFRMLLNRKLFSDRSDGALTAPCVNAVES